MTHLTCIVLHVSLFWKILLLLASLPALLRRMQLSNQRYAWRQDVKTSLIFFGSSTKTLAKIMVIITSALHKIMHRLSHFFSKRPISFFLIQVILWCTSFLICCYTVHVPTNMCFEVNANDRIYKCMYMLCFDEKRLHIQYIYICI